jgi:hypothetical protein
MLGFGTGRTGSIRIGCLIVHGCSPMQTWRAAGLLFAGMERWMDPVSSLCCPLAACVRTVRCMAVSSAALASASCSLCTSGCLAALCSASGSAMLPGCV